MSTLSVTSGYRHAVTTSRHAVVCGCPMSIRSDAIANIGVRDTEAGVRAQSLTPESFQNVEVFSWKVCL